MADRIRKRIAALVESVPLMNEIVEFTPPDLKAKTASNDGGFFQSEDVVGFEALKWSLKVHGDHKLLQLALGKYFIGQRANQRDRKWQRYNGHCLC
jgi:hypothetical protein